MHIYYSMVMNQVNSHNNTKGGIYIMSNTTVTTQQRKGVDTNMTELEEQINRVNTDRIRKYPLLDILDNREEIRVISQETQDYLVELNPDIVRPRIWEMVPRMVIEFVKASIKKLDREKAMNEEEHIISLGNIMNVGIEYLGFINAEGKSGNLTPIMTVRSEFNYEDKDLPYLDEVSADEAIILRDEHCTELPIQFFDDRKLIKEISDEAIKSLKKFGVIIPPDDWGVLPLIFVAFFRVTKKYLITHKDDDDIGIRINMAEVFYIKITKEGGYDEEDEVSYRIGLIPGKEFKKEFAKGDDITER